ncbi:phage tail protein [Lysobacter firmicutimachus]|uniref:Phage tail protein n=1 Tax=Lysobacter firmicutimachus TaxID=1792846 RepID=A0AAU8MRG0_9GAMM
MDLSYPHPGFHFLVVFELLPQFPYDTRWQEVSGLSVSTEFESWPEGGENRYAHQLPKSLQFGELMLKRGKFMGSGVLHWARKAMEQFEYKPVNLMISLLDEEHLPLYNWYVTGAVPKRLEIAGINAGSNEILIESLALQYQYFKYYDPASVALDAAAALSGSVGVSF